MNGWMSLAAESEVIFSIMAKFELAKKMFFKCEKFPPFDKKNIEITSHNVSYVWQKLRYKNYQTKFKWQNVFHIKFANCFFCHFMFCHDREIHFKFKRRLNNGQNQNLKNRFSTTKHFDMLKSVNYGCYHGISCWAIYKPNCKLFHQTFFHAKVMEYILKYYFSLQWSI